MLDELQREPPKRILLDNGIFIHSEFAQRAARPTNLRWGDTKQVLNVHGFVRKPRHKNGAYQRQIDALFTVGRLIREGRVAAYEYKEIQFERARGGFGSHDCYALKGCTINYCPTALDRPKFRMTINFADYMSKGGKKDRKAGIEVGEANLNCLL
jgi:hypothetical protein